VFVELMPLLKDRTLLLTIARVGEKVKVNVIPAKAKEGEDQALTTPLTYMAAPEELDAMRGQGLRLARCWGSASWHVQAILTTRTARATRSIRARGSLDGYFRKRTKAERHDKS